MPVFLPERLGLGPGSASSWLELPTKEDPVECCLEELGFLLTYGRHALCPRSQTQAGLPGPGHPKHLGAHTYSLSVSQPLRKILKRKESRCKRIFHNNNFLSKHYYMAISVSVHWIYAIPGLTGNITTNPMQTGPVRILKMLLREHCQSCSGKQSLQAEFCNSILWLAYQGSCYWNAL